MPKVDRQTLKNKDKIIKDISNFTKSENILAEREELKPYETDGLTAYKQTPMLVVLPENTEEVSKILSYCNKNKIKVVPRGAGTGLAGSALPLADCILLGLGKFNKILVICIFLVLYQWFSLNKLILGGVLSRSKKCQNGHRCPLFSQLQPQT